MDTLLKTLVEILVPPVFAALAALVARLIWVQADRLRSQIGEAKWNAIRIAVSEAVAAAEQSALGQLIAQEGAAKKKFALDAAQAYLDERKIPIDLNVLDNLIEAAVFNQLGWTKSEPAPLLQTGG